MVEGIHLFYTRSRMSIAISGYWWLVYPRSPTMPGRLTSGVEPTRQITRDSSAKHREVFGVSKKGRGGGGSKVVTDYTISK